MPNIAAMAKSIINIIPTTPNVKPKQPYFGAEPCGSGSERSAAISPISGEKSIEMINAQPKPMLRRLPNRATKTSRNTPDKTAKITIPSIVFCFRLSFHSVVSSEWKLLASTVGKEQLAKFFCFRCAKCLAYESAGNGRRESHRVEI